MHNARTQYASKAHARHRHTHRVKEGNQRAGRSSGDRCGCCGGSGPGLNRHDRRLVAGAVGSCARTACVRPPPARCCERGDRARSRAPIAGKISACLTPVKTTPSVAPFTMSVTLPLRASQVNLRARTAPPSSHPAAPHEPLCWVTSTHFMVLFSCKFDAERGALPSPYNWPAMRTSVGHTHTIPRPTRERHRHDASVPTIVCPHEPQMRRLLIVPVHRTGHFDAETVAEHFVPAHARCVRAGASA